MLVVEAPLRLLPEGFNPNNFWLKVEGNYDCGPDDYSSKT